jgi:hypothetical protein
VLEPALKFSFWHKPNLGTPASSSYSSWFSFLGLAIRSAFFVPFSRSGDLALLSRTLALKNSCCSWIRYSFWWRRCRWRSALDLDFSLVYSFWRRRCRRRSALDLDFSLVCLRV